MNFGIYTRKSYFTDTSDSVKMQLSACQEYIDRVFDDVTTVTPYEDDGYVRSDIDRPAMNRLREDVGAGLIDCVVIYRIDRVCSDMMDFCTFYTYLKEHEVKFVTVKDGIDTTTPIGEAMMYLAVIFSGIEIGNDSIRIRDGMNHLAARGFWCGGMAPFGYDIVEVDLGAKKHKTLIKNDEQHEEKERLVDILLTNDFSLQALETYCRQQGIRSQRGAFLSTTQLHQILRSPFCVADTPEIFDYFQELGCIMDEGSPRELWDGQHGVMVYGRTTEKRVNRKKKHVQAPPEEWRVSIGYHEPTMSAERWLQVQDHFGRKKIDKTMKHETTLLKGVLRCKCGRLMSLARKKKVDGTVSTWYKCPRRERAGDCDMGQIKAELLDEKVLEIFREIEHDPDVVKRYIKEEKQTTGSGDKNKKKIQETEKKIDRLVASLGSAKNGPAAKYIVAEIEKLDVELATLKRAEAEALQEKRRNAMTLRNAQEKRLLICEMLANFDNFTMEEKNEIAREVIQSATWDGEALFIML